jgi:hypothetical protein
MSPTSRPLSTNWAWRFASTRHAGRAVAVSYAARNPDRVTHLVQQSTIARSTDVLSPPAEALLGLAEKDWTLFTETAARFILQWSDEGLARQAAPILRECVTQDAAVSLLHAALRFDVTALLPLVKCPTLVIHNRQFPVELALARDLASHIPGARLAAADGLDSVVAAAVEFLAGDIPAKAVSGPAPRGPHPAPSSIRSVSRTGRSKSCASSPLARATARSPTNW